MEKQVLTTEGGAFLMLDKAYIELWGGVESLLTTGHIPRFRFDTSPDALPTDYDRACDVHTTIGTLKVANTDALVINTFGAPLNWYPLKSGLGYFWFDVDGTGEVIDDLEPITETTLLVQNNLAVSISSGFVVFDATIPGRVLDSFDEWMDITYCGVLNVEHIKIKLKNNSFCDLIRFREI